MTLATPPAGPPRDPPPVTVTGGRAVASGLDVLDAEPPPRRTGAWLAAVAAALVLVAAVVTADRRPPPPAPPLDLVLVAQGDELVGSQGGVLVVPVAVRGAVAGVPAEVAVTRAVVWAEPVREQPSATGRTRFVPDAGGRLRVLLQPDCRLLVPDSGIVFAATLAVDVTAPDGAPASAVLDLAAQPALATRVSALCRTGDGLRPPPTTEAQEVPATPGCPEELCTGALRDGLPR